MSQQLDSSAIKQVQDLVLSGYHLKISSDWPARQLSSQQARVSKASNASPRSAFVSVVPWKQPALTICSLFLRLRQRRRKSPLLY
jgi:hypothetical protein